MIKSEMDRFEKCRINDFKQMFIKYLENHMEHQAQVSIKKYIWFYGNMYRNVLVGEILGGFLT